MKPLENLRVLDLSRVLAGPFCTMMLADLGAKVIKIEPPNGDDSRGNAPYINGESTYFMSLNRGKRSISLDLKNEDAKAILRRLVQDADILVENYRPGTMEKLGLGYEVLKEVNPRLIYCAISGFGQTGPYKHRPAYDSVIQAMGGIMSITGQAGGPPTRVGSSIGDIISGVMGTAGILAAVESRHTTGRGQFIDIGMLDSLVYMLENPVMRYCATGINPKPVGNRHPLATPFDVFESSDGFVVIAIQNNSIWERFCKLVNITHLLEDPRFATNASRTDHEPALKEILTQILIQKTTNEWINEFTANGIPCGPLNTIADVVKDPHILHREMIVELSGHPKVGNYKVSGLPIKFSETKCVLENPAPILGQHTEEILREFGFSEEKITAFRQSGAIIG